MPSRHKFIKPFAETGRITKHSLRSAIGCLPKVNGKIKKLTVCGTVRVNRKNFDIFLRDDMTCYICNKKAVKITLSKRTDLGHKYLKAVLANGDSLTVDHWLPASLGGNSSAHNLKTCCSTCNRDRGNRVTFEELKAMKEFGLNKIQTNNRNKFRIFDVVEV